MCRQFTISNRYHYFIKSFLITISRYWVVERFVNEEDKYVPMFYFLKQCVNCKAIRNNKRFVDPYGHRWSVDIQLSSIIKYELNIYFETPNHRDKQLYNNAFAEQERLGLTPGVPLTNDQINRLSKIIIWPETQTIDGKTGLFPRVYATKSAVAQYKNSGGGIFAKSINLNVDKINIGVGKLVVTSESMNLKAKEMVLDGVIESDGDIQLQADNLKGYGAEISADDFHVEANEVEFEGQGKINTNKNFNLEVVNNASSTWSVFSGGTHTTTVGGNLGLSGDGNLASKGHLNVKAKGEITRSGSNTKTNLQTYKLKGRF